MPETGPVVVATIMPLPGREQEVETILLSAVTAVRERETGCEVSAGTRPLRGAEGFTLIEKWASAEALENRVDKAALETLTWDLAGLLAEPMVVSVLSPVSIDPSTPARG